MPILIAATRYGIHYSTLYDAVKKGKIPCRLETVYRIRVLPADVLRFKTGMNPRRREIARAAMQRRWGELAGSRFSGRVIPRPARKLVNHPGPKKATPPPESGSAPP